ncbi:MAG: phosphotransferase, partial [bacterium]
SNPGKVSAEVAQELAEKEFEKYEENFRKIEAAQPVSDFDKLALENINLKKKLILANSITYEDLNLPSDHLIHGDYLYHNTFYNTGNQVSYIFDFEKTDYSPRTYELFRSMMYSFLSQDIDQTSLNKAKLYFDSYLNIYPMNKNELERGLRLFYFKLIYGFWVESEHYLKNNNRTDHFLSFEIMRIKYLSQNLEQLGDIMLK